jgi:ribosomal protein S18 acetylase RimI-like enzyme
VKLTVSGGTPSASADHHPLDNAVWHALTGERSAFGRVLGQAAVFDAAVTPFAALDDNGAKAAWDDLRTLIGPGGQAVLFGPPFEAPEGWTVTYRIPCLQMVAAAATGARDPRLVPLAAADVPEMLRLIAETRPGPFEARTVELGGYRGLWEDGHLVAMAGERLRCDGYCEISAVCTAASLRGRGIGTALVRSLVADIRARDEEPFLHASATNDVAIRLYLALGFTIRRKLEASAVEAPA